MIKSFTKICTDAGLGSVYIVYVHCPLSIVGETYDCANSTSTARAEYQEDTQTLPPKVYYPIAIRR